MVEGKQVNNNIKPVKRPVCLNVSLNKITMLKLDGNGLYVLSQFGLARNVGVEPC